MEKVIVKLDKFVKTTLGIKEGFFPFLENVISSLILIFVLVYFWKNRDFWKKLFEQIYLNYLLDKGDFQKIYELKGKQISKFDFIPKHIVVEIFMENEEDKELLALIKKLAKEGKELELVKKVVFYLLNKNKFKEEILKLVDKLFPILAEDLEFLKNILSYYDSSDNKYLEIIKIINEKEPTIENKLALAEIYEKNFQKVLAKDIYEELLIENFSDNIFEKYLKSLLNLEEYTQLIMAISTYLKQSPNLCQKYLLTYLNNNKELDYQLIHQFIENNWDNFDFYDLAQKTEDIKIIRLVAEKLLKEAQTEKAKILLEKLLELSPDDKEAKSTLANILYEDKMFSKSLSLYFDLLESNFYEEKEIFNFLLPRLEKLFQYVEKEEEKKKLLIALLDLYKKFDLSQKIIDILTTREKENGLPLEEEINFLNLKAQCYLKLKKTEEAINILKKLIQKDPDNIENYHQLINLYLFQKNDEEAKKVMEQLAKIEPTSDNFIRLIDMYLLDEEYEKAEDKIIELLKLDPGNPQYRFQYGEILLKSGKLDLAIKEFQYVSKNSPQLSLISTLQLGIAWLRKGEVKIASEIFQKIDFDQLPEDIRKEFFYLIGFSFQEEGYYQEALQYYKKILILDVGYKDVYYTVTQLNEKIKNPPTKLDTKKEKVRPSDTAFRKLKKEKIIGGRYVDLVELGIGGMGTVYKGRDIKLNRTVAIKVLKKSLAGDPHLIERFLREAQAVAILNHPNIVALYDIVDEGIQFITMEYVDGITLRNVLKKKKIISIKKSCKIIITILEALDYAHNKGIIHRDIKPDNIMISKDGKIKIMDFGLAKIESDQPFTANNIIMGTEWYMSPEQARGHSGDRRSDIYSVGIMFYEMITGEVPFRKGDISYQHLNVPPTPPKEKNPEVPEWLNKIILKALEKKPENRFQTAQQMADAIKKGLK